MKSDTNIQYNELIPAYHASLIPIGLRQHNDAVRNICCGEPVPFIYLEQLICEVYKEMGWTRPIVIDIASPAAYRVALKELNQERFFSITSEAKERLPRFAVGTSTTIAGLFAISSMRLVEAICKNSYPNTSDDWSSMRGLISPRDCNQLHKRKAPKTRLERALCELIRHSFIVNMYKNLVCVLDRPRAIHRDNTGVPHREDGRAVEFRDGTGLCYWHGEEIPLAWVRGELPTPAKALTISNMEQRRVACEMIGWDKILDTLHAKVINTDSNPMIGTLIEVELPSMSARVSRRGVMTMDLPIRQRFLRVKCGTGRNFALPVPPTMKTALEANAWTYGIDPSFLQPEVRT